jgi:GT2 family glycosyltransferase
MRVAAVIPNWNGAHLLRRLLPTIVAQTRAFDSILVVDNGSSDDSIAVAESLGAQVISFQSNRGFAPAVNAGVAASESDVVAILNNDVELDPGWLQILHRRLDDDSVSFVTGKTVSTADPHVIDGTFDAICRGGSALRCGWGREDGPLWAASRKIQFAPFTALLIRSRVFLALGGLDEAFESYLEDVEFGLRCASVGHTGIYEPAAVAKHAGSATLGMWNPRTVRNISRNQVLLLARHYDPKMLRRFGWSIAVAQLLWGLVAIRRGAAAAWLTGKVEGLRRFSSEARSGDPRLIPVLEASERLIREVQSQTGFDLYWRLYFALTTRV